MVYTFAESSGTTVHTRGKKISFVDVFAGLWMPGILIKFPLNNVVRKLYLAALPRQYELNTKVLDPSIEYVA